MRQDEAKELGAQRHKAELKQQMGAHEEARRAERAARAAETRSIKVRRFPVRLIGSRSNLPVASSDL